MSPLALNGKSERFIYVNILGQHAFGQMFLGAWTVDENIGILK